MRQIRGAAARAFELGVARVEQRVDLCDQRPNFERRVARQAPPASARDRGNLLAQGFQRSQPEAELHESRCAEHQREQRQTWGEVGHKSVARGFKARKVAPGDDPNAPRLAMHRLDAALGDEQQLSIRTRDLVIVRLAFAEIGAGQVQIDVP